MAPVGWALLEESLAGHRADGDDWGTAARLAVLGAETHKRGDLESAVRSYGESLTLLTALGDRWLVNGPLAGLADLAATSGDPARAARFLGAIAEARERSGGRPPPSAVPYWEHAERAVRCALTDEERIGEMRTGRTLSRRSYWPRRPRLRCGSRPRNPPGRPRPMT